MPNFAVRLRELRTALGLRQKDLAEKIGLAQTTIANYEMDSRFPDQATLNKFADFFQVSLDYLLGRSDVPNVENKAEGLSKNPSFTMTLPELQSVYLELLLKGQWEAASQLVLNAVQAGSPIRDVYVQVFEQTLKETGHLWETNQIDVAQEHFITNATLLAMCELHPYTRQATRRWKTLVAMTATGELHDMGLRMVTDFLSLDGWTIYYLGSNTPTQSAISALSSTNAELLAISATMSFHVESAANIISAVRASPLGRRVKIMVGGRAFSLNPSLSKQVGADGYAANAAEAVIVANELTK